MTNPVLDLSTEPPHSGDGALAVGGPAHPAPDPVFSLPPGADAAVRAADAPGRWRPTVAMIVVVVVLLPLVATGILAGKAASSRWSFRQTAQSVATDADRLATMAYARARLNAVRVPAQAVSFAASIGVDEATLSSLLGINFASSLASAQAVVDGDTAFTSTPTLRADVAELRTLLPEITSGSVPYDQVKTFMTTFASDIDNVWYADFARLQRDVSAWQPPGNFEVQVSALRQTYGAFLAGGNEIEGAIYVLENQGGEAAKVELIQAIGNFDTATSQFQSNLGPTASRVWATMQTSAAAQSFDTTVHEGQDVAINGGTAPFVSHVSDAGKAMTNGLSYLDELDALVRAESLDLRTSALSQASSATRQFVLEIVFLAVLAVISVGGAIFAGRTLTRPLKRLSAAASRIHVGEFDIDELPEDGPREVVLTTEAFNDMSSTLKGVETKTVALATENLSHPDLQNPLPGRTGQALQAAVDQLTTRIREREIQRRELHEAATHDRLTSLLNRAAVFEFLEHDVARRRQAGETVAVIFVDLDGLKPLNDTYGHEAGDAAIRATAAALLEATGDCDVVGRLGGDEFLVVLCDKDSSDGHGAAERIRQTVGRRSIPVGNTLVPLQASVGVALTECDASTDPTDLVRQADEAMYGAKKSARATRDHLAAIAAEQDASPSAPRD